MRRSCLTLAGKIKTLKTNRMQDLKKKKKSCAKFEQYFRVLVELAAPPHGNLAHAVRVGGREAGLGGQGTETRA